ncbi:MAG: replication-relaxation family protein [Phycisphaerae bacterium]|nr:replication-relaxation family protein [Phycisphaerae bacterium]
MANKLNKNDRELLVSLAEYRLLTVSQIAALCAVGKPAARNRVGKLTKAALATERTPAVAGGRGRPERWVSLTERGIDSLRADGTLGRSVPRDEVAADGIRCSEHLLAINWFRIHLVHLERTFPRLSTTFLSSESPFLERGPDGRRFVADRVPPAESGGKPVPFIPDGVFTLRDHKSGKALLFFLEVDRGSETLASGRRGAKDIRTKVINYQQYFRVTGYKRYQDLWDCVLNGFRLLFLAHTPARLAALCRLVQEVPPSDFVWLTDQDRMFAKGVSADIWARGGKLDAPPESIIGKTLSHAAPLSGGQCEGSAEPESHS